MFKLSLLFPLACLASGSEMPKEQPHHNNNKDIWVEGGPKWDELRRTGQTYEYFHVVFQTL